VQANALDLLGKVSLIYALGPLYCGLLSLSYQII